MPVVLPVLIELRGGFAPVGLHRQERGQLAEAHQGLLRCDSLFGDRRRMVGGHRQSSEPPERMHERCFELAELRQATLDEAPIGVKSLALQDGIEDAVSTGAGQVIVARSRTTQ